MKKVAVGESLEGRGGERKSGEKGGGGVTGDELG